MTSINTECSGTIPILTSGVRNKWMFSLVARATSLKRKLYSCFWQDTKIIVSNLNHGLYAPYIDLRVFIPKGHAHYHCATVSLSLGYGLLIYIPLNILIFFGCIGLAMYCHLSCSKIKSVLLLINLLWLFSSFAVKVIAWFLHSSTHHTWWSFLSS